MIYRFSGPNGAYPAEGGAIPRFLIFQKTNNKFQTKLSTNLSAEVPNIWDVSGERGIRTPGTVHPYGSLANCWFQPLTHLSVLYLIFKNDTTAV